MMELDELSATILTKTHEVVTARHATWADAVKVSEVSEAERTLQADVEFVFKCDAEDGGMSLDRHLCKSMPTSPSS